MTPSRSGDDALVTDVRTGLQQECDALQPGH